MCDEEVISGHVGGLLCTTVKQRASLLSASCIVWGGQFRSCLCWLFLVMERLHGRAWPPPFHIS